MKAFFTIPGRNKILFLDTSSGNQGSYYKQHISKLLYFAQFLMYPLSKQVNPKSQQQTEIDPPPNLRAKIITEMQFPFLGGLKGFEKVAPGAQLPDGFQVWNQRSSERLQLQDLQGWRSLPLSLLAPAHRALAFSLSLKVSLEAESSKFAWPLVSGRPPGRTRDEAEPWFSLQLSQTPSSSFGPQWQV